MAKLKPEITKVENKQEIGFMTQKLILQTNQWNRQMFNTSKRKGTNIWLLKYQRGYNHRGDLKIVFNIISVS